MRLLICTQVVDKDDLVLGFFHRWIEEFAKQCENITVVCLKEGKHSLPDNVEVLSLGKEVGTSRVTRVWRFFRFIIARRNGYDAVFVHMNEEYVLLGGWLWKRWGKRVYMWRNHYIGSKRTDAAARWCNKIFCTSKFSYTMKYPKTELMPVGVDLERFVPLSDTSRDPRGILFLSRMAPSKRLEVLLHALALLKKDGIHCNAALYGSPQQEDEKYYESLKELARVLGIDDMVAFHPGLPNSETPRLYNSYSIFVNCSISGMFDKTLFEAAACECIVVAASEDLGELVGDKFIFKAGDSRELAERLNTFLALPVLERQGLGVTMRHMAEGHSLTKLAGRLAEEMSV